MCIWGAKSFLLPSSRFSTLHLSFHLQLLLILQFASSHFLSTCECRCLHIFFIQMKSQLFCYNCFCHLTVTHEQDSMSVQMYSRVFSRSLSTFIVRSLTDHTKLWLYEKAYRHIGQHREDILGFTDI